MPMPDVVDGARHRRPGMKGERSASLALREHPMLRNPNILGWNVKDRTNEEKLWCRSIFRLCSMGNLM